ncbi:helix-turn-helix domain-containing protein [Paenibacillus donghaensis]|uniref:Transcriptional regulator n=1 Tax=Paenibacillus donghaensis TaxID=414771 RepID=A0A2Z2KKD3_9BACL|nr:helix-turn-helix transcriptional regulator [Paenibacillus donghaensis]ASA23790.1 transcriptional regulator [Paenibacillus donghaensis]
MYAATTIRAELENFIHQEGLNYSQLGKRAGLNPGTVSAIFSGNKVFGVDQLDRMTTVLSLPAGYFYNQYIQECMIEAVPNWRRIRPLIYRCAELDKLDCIRQIVNILLDHLTYAVLLWEVAEDWYSKGIHRQASLLLYESVASTERRQYSERLALCHYRIFTLSISQDQSQNFKAACQFEPFITRLDEVDQLDALKDIANIYRSLKQWDKVQEYAQDMGNKAEIQYHLMRNSKQTIQDLPKKPSRPLFVYIAYSNLLLANVYDVQKDYQKALEYTYAYADLSWVTETDPETQHWVNLFQKWAITNTYINKLRAGDLSVLPDYVQDIEGTTEINAELLNIVEVANCYKVDIDHILQRFESYIFTYVQEQSEDIYTQQVIPDASVQLCYQLAKYYLNKNKYTRGFNILGECLIKASLINNESAIINCVGLFEHFEEYATSEIRVNYQKSIKKVWVMNEKEISLARTDC